MSPDGSDPAAGEPDDRPAPTQREQTAFWVFVAYLAIALPLLLWMGSYRWFFGDEWSFLAGRSATDLFEPHNQHWSTLPVLVYRGMYSLFGLHTYLPYQLLVILLHLGLAGLLRGVMRRADVDPWIATVAAGAFVLLGPAEDNILWAFQIGFVGTMLLGLSQAVLADHSGAIDRRDWYGLGLGGIALMTSGQAPALVMATGLVCLLRRRWPAAAFHTLPLGLLYLIWYVASGVDPVFGTDESPFTIGAYAEWMSDAVRGVFAALGYVAPISVALAALLVAGLVLAARAERSALLERAAVPLALLVAAVITMSLAAPSRFFLGEDPARAGRYIGVMAALILPALAVAADALMKRWPVARWPVLLLLLVAIPLNATRFGDDPLLTPQQFDHMRSYVLTLARHPLTPDAAPWVAPNENLLGQPDMTVGWLLTAEKNGELPALDDPLDPVAASTIPIQLGVAHVEDDAPDSLTCVTQTDPAGLSPEVGDRLEFVTAVGVALRDGFLPSTRWVEFTPGVVEITLPDLELLVGPATGETEFRICR